MSLGFRVVAHSHVGVVRTSNEDAGLASTRLIAVADGMGGHAAGEVASAAVIQTLHSEIAAMPNTRSELRPWLVNTINEAHGVVGDLVAADSDRRGMGTTLSALVVGDDGVMLGHIGDSRIYRLRAEHFEQLSIDHTYVQSLVDSGNLTPEQAANHPRRNLLMRAIDGIHDVEVDISEVEAAIGDRFLICSDGLTGMLSDQVLQQALALPDLTLGVAQLIEFALAAGANDNVTVILAELTDEPTAEDFLIGCAADAAIETPAPPAAKRGYRKWLALFAVLVLAAFGIGNWWQSQWFLSASPEFVQISHGIPQQIGPLSLSSVAEVSHVQVISLTPLDQQRIAQTIAADSLTEAEQLIEQLAKNGSCLRTGGSCD